MKVILSLFIFVSAVLLYSASAQIHSKIWQFGDKAGIDFNTPLPVSINTGMTFSSEGGTTVTDESGKLLFYVSYRTVFNKNGLPMIHGAGLLGNGGSSAESPLIIQNPADKNQYYVFMAADETDQTFRGNLNYSIVDMCLENGLGDVDVSIKNIQIPGTYSERLTAIPLKNGKAYWIVCSGLFNNTIYSIYLDKNGVNPSPIVSNFGNEYSAEVGFIVANHNRTQILYSSSLDQNNGVWIMDFDTINGSASNKKEILLYKHLYGIAFSPNDRFVYYSYFYGYSGIHQYDLQTNVDYEIVDYTGDYLFGQIAESPDKKLYIARPFQNFVSSIVAPDVSGAGCKYFDNSLTLRAGTTCRLTLQNGEFYFGAKPITNSSGFLGQDTTLCIPLNYTLTVKHPAPVWSDGSSKPNLPITKAGTYWVSYSNCDTLFTDTIHIDIKNCNCQRNFQWLTIDTLLCPGTIASFKFNTNADSVFINNLLFTNDSFFISGLINDSCIRVNLHFDVLCDSTFDLCVKKLTAPIPFSDTLHFCEGDSIFFKNVWYKDSATFRFHDINYRGCDSVSNIYLSKHVAQTYQNQQFICFGDSVLINNQWYFSNANINLKLVDAHGCDSLVLIQLIEFPKVETSKEIFYICNGDSIQIANTWYNDSTRIKQILKDMRGCDSIHEIEIRMKPSPAPENFQFFICKGDSIQIANYWISNERKISVHKMNLNACDSIFNYEIRWYDDIYVDLPEEQIINIGDAYQIISTNSSNTSNFSWYPPDGLSCTNCSDPFANPINDTKYYLIVTDLNGCKAIDSILIRVKFKEGNIYLPNVFSPNGDNINDYWTPVFDPINGSIQFIRIFDRWGDLVYDCETSQTCLYWNGTFKNEKCLPGVYAYHLLWKANNGNLKNFSGSITLIR